MFLSGNIEHITAPEIWSFLTFIWDQACSLNAKTFSIIEMFSDDSQKIILVNIYSVLTMWKAPC